MFYRIALGIWLRNTSAFLFLILAMSCRRMFASPSCGVALQGLIHCVLWFEKILETHFDFTPRGADIPAGRWNTNPGFILVGAWFFWYYDVYRLRICLFVAKAPLKPYFVLFVKVCSSPFVVSASLPCHPMIRICLMHVLSTFLVWAWFLKVGLLTRSQHILCKGI